MRIHKIVALSDTHNQHGAIKVPDGDFLIHPGDATGSGGVAAINAFLVWMGEQTHKHKIFVAGNHDLLFERNGPLARQMCADNGVIYLEDSGIELEGIKFWGSPMTPWFYGERWAFNRGRNLSEAMYHGTTEIKPHWDMIPDDTDILITHGPPYDILDEVLMVDGSSYSEIGQLPRYVGCVELLEAVKRVKPDIHIFGHIHCAFGQKHQDGTSFYNVAVLDDMYTPTNGCTVIDYVKEVP